MERDLGRHPKVPRDRTVVPHTLSPIESRQRLVRQQHMQRRDCNSRFFATCREAVTARQYCAEKQVSKPYEVKFWCAIRFVDVNENYKRCRQRLKPGTPA